MPLFRRKRKKSAEVGRFEAFCGDCGERIPPLAAHAVACPTCGHALRKLAAEPSPEQGQSCRRHARTAALLSLFVPGGGQLFNGHYFRALLVLGTFWMVVPWALSVFEAYFSARRSAEGPMLRFPSR